MNFKLKLSVRELCQVAMLIALTFVLERFVPVVSLPGMRISFAFVPMMLCGMLFGPVWGGLSFGVADILGWPIMGLTPLPLILLSRIVQGALYGLFFYRENLSLITHAIPSAVIIQVICGAGLTTFALSQLLGTPYFTLLTTRLPQFGVFIILNIAVFPVLVKAREALLKAGLVNPVASLS